MHQFSAVSSFNFGKSEHEHVKVVVQAGVGVDLRASAQHCMATYNLERVGEPANRRRRHACIV